MMDVDFNGFCLGNVSAFLPFKNHLEKLKKFNTKSLKIDNVVYFGDRIGFMLVTSLHENNGKFNKVVSFLRGNSVAILPVFNTEFGKFTIVTHQDRIPAGVHNHMAIPAGMMDDSDDMLSVALKELQEETGFCPDSETHAVFRLLDESYPSAGGSDEMVTTYSICVGLPYAKLLKYGNMNRGVDSENERIVTDVVPLSSLKMSSDMKTKLAYYRYIEVYGE